LEIKSATVGMGSWLGDRWNLNGEVRMGSFTERTFAESDTTKE
jgi:hypothetical protein